MKLSTGQYKAIIAVMSVIILALLAIQFEFDDLVGATLEQREDKDMWSIEPHEYETREDGTEHIIIKVEFTNSRLFEDSQGTPTECTHFDFQFLPSGGNLELQNFATIEDIPLGESFEMTYDSVMTPSKKYYGLSESMTIYVRAFDEDHNLIDRDITKTISLSRSEQPIIEEEPEPEPTPGFEAVFAIAGLLAVIYLIKKE